MINNDISKMLDLSFASSAQSIFINSLSRPVMFREARVKEQKAISKIVIPNKDRLSIVYGATLSLIKLLCYDEEFDINSITEFDRLKILSSIYSSNFLSKKIHFTCPKKDCKNHFVYNVQYGDIIKGFELCNTDDIVFENKMDIGYIKVYINFPSCIKYLNFLELIDTKNDIEESEILKKSNNKFSELNKLYDNDSAINSGINDDMLYKMFGKQNNENNAQKQNTTTNNSNSVKSLDLSMKDASDLYIKKIEYALYDNTDENGELNIYSIDMSQYGILDVEEILGHFPIKMFTREDGVTLNTFINSSISNKIKTCLPIIKCPKCGEILNKYISLRDFFIFG